MRAFSGEGIMRVTAALALMLLAAPAAAQQNERYTEPTEAIVVTGIRVQDYRDRLAACLARRCPTNEDVDASLALAEALFLTGEYGDARRTVRASIGRNRRAAGEYPEPVSDLYRAHTRLSRHLGHDDQAARSANDILRALQEGLPQEDYRHFTARLEIADLQMAMGNFNRARRELSRLAELARATGREDVAIMAGLRRIWFDYVTDPYGEPRSRLIEMAASTDPAQRLQATGAKVLLARIYRAEGDTRRADALLAEIGRGSAAQRRLISSPPYQLQMREVPNAMEMVTNSGGSRMALESVVNLGNTINRMPDNYRDKWIDVGFWVMPDGHVSGLEVVRQGSEHQWAAPLLESIGNRLYSTAAQPTYRLERYTYTSRVADESASRIRQQSRNARVEYLDLTTDNPPPPSPPSGGAI